MRDTVGAKHLAEIPRRWEDVIVTFAYDLVDDRLQVTDVSFRREDGGPITWTRMARRLPFSALAIEALAELRTHWAPQILALAPSETAVRAAQTLVGTPGPRRGRPPLYGPQHWAEVAEVARFGPQAVAARWSLSYATAWRWCQEAKRLT